ncbi:MAG: diaminopimelate epimerase [Acidimicrobiales bacterium]
MVKTGSRRATRPVGREPVAGTGFPMVKLEAAGNDFLVVLDAGGDGSASCSLSPAQVRLVCDRRRGVGADGIILGRRGGPGTDLEMVLYNADGSEAEMSGNGIRCLVHAAVLAGVAAPPEVRVATASGVRTVDYEPATSATGGRAWARVEMGPVRLGPEVASPLPGARARLADVGNPHLVVIGDSDHDVDLDHLDLHALSSAATRAAGAAVNLEVVRPGRCGADFELRVLERGVGETLACGTGTCAVAAVARAWGMSGDRVTVDNPGGRLEVRLGGHAGADAASETIDGVELGGPVRKVADVEVDSALVDSALVDTALHEGG